MSKKQTYWSNVISAIKTLTHGLVLTFRHITQARKSSKSFAITQPGYFDAQQGIATVQYPFETIPVPDNGRYKLHNEIDDCIVCDKCAKVCPVDCITIEPIRSPEEFGKTSDGTSKRIYAAVFDIDMAKCCFCGLCTTVCPTECLTMTKEYDFSTFDITTHNFGFGNMTVEEIEQRKTVWANHQQSKTQTTDTTTIQPKPVVAIKPKFKPPSPSQPNS
ncbi:MAG TPA: 4Fe-4S binding protein [Cyclobacteriaceae bacterium]|jgi:formate hydrogenlyase subunit 6/NADH:ubiquinone oxidoreductase subunit I|nr:4Fe-4S binding protein [Cytophagales bacterium]HMR57309.1 4Fe-4S binding protein [Cyclobacteriaceae bacterium]HNT50172.1 4Fe-4S binding protein [Cyclobacteriaceae bacterium]HRE65904.1 4Fe-4S binding protein [Cyclobacteriaceae bacterium]HRF33748.1 4Fe-4S binding protein [Cyclobacteriaceae bacterium]